MTGLRGQTLAQAHPSITLQEYHGWSQDEQYSPLDIEGIYTRIQLQRAGGN